MRLFTGRAYPELADEVAYELGIPITPTSAYDFANGEIFIRFEESVRGSDAFVLQSHSAPVNKQIMEQLIMVDALKRASAKRITVILPFYGYARQDKKHRGREPISARLMADLFKTAGADRLMCVDLHTSQIQGFFDGPVDHLFALPLLTNYVGSKVDRKNLVIVSPDSGRVRVAERWSELLGGCSIAFIHKTRDPKVPNEATVGKVVGDVKGMTCVVIDDMIDTAGTVTKAVDALSEEGDKHVIIAATHAVLSGPAVDRLKKNVPSILEFYNIAEGQALIRKMARTHGLCLRLCFLQDAAGACTGEFAATCKGACTRKETADHYNQRVKLAVEELVANGSFLILDKGRNSKEMSCILVEKGTKGLSFGKQEKKMGWKGY